jgi:hypothetical protein
VTQRISRSGAGLSGTFARRRRLLVVLAAAWLGTLTLLSGAGAGLDSLLRDGAIDAGACRQRRSAYRRD